MGLIEYEDTETDCRSSLKSENECRVQSTACDVIALEDVEENIETRESSVSGATLTRDIVSTRTNDQKMKAKNADDLRERSSMNMPSAKGRKSCPPAYDYSYRKGRSDLIKHGDKQVVAVVPGVGSRTSTARSTPNSDHPKTLRRSSGSYASHKSDIDAILSDG